MLPMCAYLVCEQRPHGESHRPNDNAKHDVLHFDRLIDGSDVHLAAQQLAARRLPGRLVPCVAGTHHEIMKPQLASELCRHVSDVLVRPAAPLHGDASTARAENETNLRPREVHSKTIDILCKEVHPNRRGDAHACGIGLDAHSSSGVPARQKRPNLYRDMHLGPETAVLRR